LMRRLLAGEIRDYKMEKRYFKKNGEIVHALLSVSQVRDDGGQPLYFVAQILNITAEKLRVAEREELIGELQNALAQVKTLGGLLPICACCKSIRDDQGYWKKLETYLREHSGVSFTHDYCPECLVKEFERNHLPVPPEVQKAKDDWRRKQGSF
jgi:hypothetical protein